MAYRIIKKGKTNSRRFVYIKLDGKDVYADDSGRVFSNKKLNEKEEILLKRLFRK